MANKKENDRKERFPESLSTETALLGILLSEPDVANDLGLKLTEEYFHYPNHKKIFGAIRALSLDSVVDAVTVFNYLEKQEDVSPDLLTYMLELVNSVVDRYNSEAYVKVLYNEMILRRINKVGKEIVNESLKNNSADSALAFAEREILDLSENISSDEALKHVSESTNEFVMMLNELSKDRNAFKGLYAGYSELDKVLGGLKKNTLTILAARPSVGKSSFITNMIANILEKDYEKNKKSDKVIAFFSLEMASEEIVRRLISTMSEVTMKSTFDGTINDQDIGAIFDIKKMLDSSQLYIEASSLLTPENILSKCRRLKIKHGRIDLIVVDYLQLLSYEDPTKSSYTMNDTAEVTRISRMLKKIAMDLKCPVVALSQLKRIDGRTGPVIIPKLSDLRQSGSIEQDADIVMFLAREKEEAEDKSSGYIVLAIEKNRNGPLRKIMYKWEGPHVRFTEDKDRKPPFVE